MKRLLATLFLGLVMSFSFMPAFASAQIPDELPKPVTPKLQIPIPGLNFEGSVIVSGNEPVEGCEPNKVCVSVIGRYINAIFRYGLGAGIIFTIVLIMVGGVQWMVGSAVGSIDKAKKRIQNASIGLVLLLTATVFLTFLNPAITALNTLKLTTIPKAPPLEQELIVGNSVIETDVQNDEGETVNVASVRLIVDPSTGETRTHPNVDARLGAGVELLHADMIEPLHRVANSLNVQTNGRHGIEIIAGFSDPAQTMRRFYEICVQGSGSCAEIVCNPLPAGNQWIEGDYETGFKLTSHAQSVMRDQNLNETQLVELMAQEASENDRRSCPYTTGYAVGVICDEQNERAITDLNCQIALEETMKRKGFCRSYFSPWHYELAGKQTSVHQCDWKEGSMLRPLRYCSSGQGADVDYNTSGDGSPCAIDYSALTSSCVRFDLRTGRCNVDLSEFDGGGF